MHLLPLIRVQIAIAAAQGTQRHTLGLSAIQEM